MPNRRRTGHGKFVSLILPVILGLAIGVLGGFAIDQRISPVSENVTQPSASASTVPETEHYEASLFITGDALLHDPISNEALQPDGSSDFSRVLGRIGKIAGNYDLAYYNQETILGGDELGIQGYPTFNAMQGFGDAMVNYGFNLVSLANNHSLDQGTYGVNHSNDYWKTKQGVVTAGTYNSAAEQQDIPVHEVNGITYAFLSWTYGTNGISPEYDYLVNIYEGHEQEMLDQVKAAKAKADVVIAAIHWGVEYQMEPSEEQKRLAQELSDAGADIILGNHAHMIEPIQRINDHTICFYAMGNLLSAQYAADYTGYNDPRVEMMASLKINKDVKDGQTEITINDVRADLMYQAFDVNTATGFEVVPFNEMSDDTYVVNHEALYQQYLPVITQMDSEVKIGL